MNTADEEHLLRSSPATAPRENHVKYIYIYFMLSTIFFFFQKFQHKRYYGINIKVNSIFIYNTAISLPPYFKRLYYYNQYVHFSYFFI